ncbi:MAG TPA: GGDEF domain-containing protein [Blastocatellia bacterium]|jgi:diguanylate cyclase (GGDEF)-like protein|nr:GGDEF domain-containing protein [Blastocatellia bacterium]
MKTGEVQRIIGLTIQCAGIFLVTILSFFVTRSIERRFLEYWTVAWGCLSIALSALVISFRFPLLHDLLQPVYLLGEYVFGFMFVYGCRNYATGALLAPRHFRLLVPGFLVALLLSRVSPSFETLFIARAAILAVLFAAAYIGLRPSDGPGKRSPGLRVMSFALVLLALDFLHYILIFGYVALTGTREFEAYLKYTSIYDLILEMLLGFGTIMVVMEDVSREVENTNRELVKARDRLEVLVRIDPLTEALNRHAFYSLLERKHNSAPATSGCVVVVDIDNLKPINDSLGHTAGDAAIREVAKAIRSVIRADDLLFRWGGDEFLILLLNIAEADARLRIRELNAALALTRLPGSSTPVPLLVSYGLASFSAMSQIEQSIDQADSAMYARKQARKRSDDRQAG